MHNEKHKCARCMKDTWSHISCEQTHVTLPRVTIINNYAQHQSFYVP